MRELKTVYEVHTWLNDAERHPATFLKIDLTALEKRLAEVSLAGCVFLGCSLTPGCAARIFDDKGIIVAERRDIPFDSLRPSLYRAKDIYAGFDPDKKGSLEASFDHLAYLWFMNPRTRLPKSIGIADTVAARLHDAAMERSVARFLHHEGLPAVGVMGGHDRSREDAAYVAIARLARQLRRQGRMVVTGGGPGFMEAASLGAFLAPYPDDTLDQVMAILVQVPEFRDHHAWLATACEVRTRLLGGWTAEAPRASSNLGIPTWLFGHQPPNLFATHIGKFFYNSLREDGLVTVADGGIIFAEGNAGTIQEVFQDAAQNYYRPAGTAPTPMVFFDSTRGFWNSQGTKGADGMCKRPVLPVLRQLSKECACGCFDQAILITDNADEILHFLTASPAAKLAVRQSRSHAWRARLIDQDLHDLDTCSPCAERSRA